MTLASVASILKDHVTLEIEGIDRMYLNVFVPQLQRELGVVGFFRNHRQQPVVSSALMDPMTRTFIASIESFAKRSSVAIVPFARGQRKDDVMKERLVTFAAPEGVVFIGKAQEKVRAFRTEKRHHKDGTAYPWVVRTSLFVNQYYMYCKDEDFGPFFLKFSSYFPYGAKLCINGHEYLKQQLLREGIPFTALDNGLESCADPARAQAICDGLTPEKIDALLRKWLAKLPHPFTPQDQAAGFRYELSIQQAEFSLTQVLDKPVTGRLFFEQVIRENLDVGRPSRVQLIFDRRVIRTTPGSFRTRVVTHGVTPSLHAEYKSCHIKQYYKEGRALRTETTINNTRDFAIGRLLKNLPALRAIGFSANRRLLDVQRISHDSTIGEDVFDRLQHPVRDEEHRRAPALRFGDSRVQTILAAVVLFTSLPRGFANRDLRASLAEIRGLDPGRLTQGQLTYELRRLRLHGLIERLPRSHRYRLTDKGLRVALLYTRLHARVLRPSLAVLHQPLAASPAPLRRAIDRVRTVIDGLCREEKLAA